MGWERKKWTTIDQTKLFFLFLILFSVDLDLIIIASVFITYLLKSQVVQMLIDSNLSAMLRHFDLLTFNLYYVYRVFDMVNKLFDSLTASKWFLNFQYPLTLLSIFNDHRSGCRFIRLTSGFEKNKNNGTFFPSFANYKKDIERWTKKKSIK